MHPDVQAVRGRSAVAVLFLVNGFLTGSWAPQIPVLLSRLGIGESTLGVLILVFGAGAVAAMSWCGYLISRHGAGAVLRVFSASATVGLLLVAAAPAVPLAAVAMFLFGGLIGGMDVAMNANGVAVEKGLRRAVMSSLHGFWSLGGFAGGAVGGLAIERLGYVSHAVAVALVAAGLVVVALPRVYSDEPPAREEKPRIGLPRHPTIYLLGLMAMFSMIPEGAVLDWAALYMQQELGADLATAGLAFAGFAATMAAVRFLGDGVRNRFGAVATVRVSALVATAGMAAAGLSASPWLAIAGFALCGLGIANIVPIAFSAAGNQDGLSAGAGMSVVTTMGYSGILLAPSAIGFIGEASDFGPVFVTLSGLLAVIFLMSGLARAADLRTG